VPDAFERVPPRAIATERLTLEPQVVAHAARMFALLQDPAIYRYENEAPASLDWLQERFRRLESRASADGREQWLNWVVRIGADELIGFVQATIDADRAAAIAYVFGSVYWGRGYATEAVSAMLRDLVVHHDVVEYSAVLKRANARSIRLLQRLGFEPDANAVPDAERTRESILADEMRMTRRAA
jgi:RimJ/RimL family protein N-acetyltransferase